MTNTITNSFEYGKYMWVFLGVLAAAVHKNAYSKAQIREILSAAHELKLDIIPLVQTFGHLEWFLKLSQFAKYRQVDRYPQVCRDIW